MLDFQKEVHSNSYVKRAASKAGLQDYEGAMEDYNKAIELYPNNMKAYYSRGMTRVLIEQIDRGCLDLSKAGELGYAGAYESIKELCN